VTWVARTGEKEVQAMAVVSATTITLRPGTYEAFLETTRTAKTILERCGAKNFRALATLVAGEATMSVAVSWEADDYASYGAVMDKFLADSEGVALLTDSTGPDGPTASFQGSLWSDIPL
jgi:hypothetical protein